MNDLPWWVPAVGGVVAIVLSFGLGYRAGNHGVAIGETKTVVVDNTKTFADELAEARRRLDEERSKHANVKTVAETFGPPVPGCAQPPLASRTTTVDLSTEDLKLTLNTTAKSRSTTIGETSHTSPVEKPVAKKWGASLVGGVDTATWRPVVGVAGEYKWARLTIVTSPLQWYRPTVLLGVGVHF